MKVASNIFESRSKVRRQVEDSIRVETSILYPPHWPDATRYICLPTPTTSIEELGSSLLLFIRGDV